MTRRPLQIDEMEKCLVIGNRTREVIRGNCQELSDRQIFSAGITWARAPYRVVRHRMNDGHLIATLGGEGEICLDGKWRRCGAGDIFINPPESPEAFRAIPKHQWFFCWLHTFSTFFDPRPDQETRIIRADPRLFHLAVEGFLHSSAPSAVQAWADLMRAHALDLISPLQAKLRLARLWAVVTQELNRSWTIDSLAQTVGLSREQLRFYARQETGRSPMHHVAYLRVQRAIDILKTSDYKLDTVANLVGYSNGFALSKVFLKFTGQRPSRFPRRATWSQSGVPLMR